MKVFKFVPWLFGLALTSCTATPQPLNPSGPAVCDDGAHNPSARVEKDVAVVGRGTNSIRVAGDEIFIVESLDNTVSRFDTTTQTYEVLVDLGNGRGPWDVWIHEDELWITNYVANTVTVADRSSGEVIAEIGHESLEGPAGIAVLDDRVYIGNTQFRGVGDYGPGSVTVIDRVTHEVHGATTTKRQNPQALDVVNGRLLVVDSGLFSFDGTRYAVGSEAAIELWTPTPDPLLPELSVAVLPMTSDRTIGIPGRPAHRDDSSIIYLPSATAPVVFAFDVERAEWTRGADDPIRLYETNRDALHHAALGAGGILYVTAFNEDALYLVDTSCDAVLDVVELDTSTMLAGPHGVVPLGDIAYVVLAQANELRRVELDFGGSR